MAKNDASDLADWIFTILWGIGALWAYSAGHYIVGTILFFVACGALAEQLDKRKRKKDEGHKGSPRPPPPPRPQRAAYPQKEHERWPPLADVKAALLPETGGMHGIRPSLTTARAPHINPSADQKRVSPGIPPNKEAMEIPSSSRVGADARLALERKHTFVTQNQKVEKLLAKLVAAAEALEFPAIGSLTVDLFWLIVEARPELNELLLLAERESDRIRKACDDYDSVTFANLLHKVLSEGAVSCLTESARQNLVRSAAQLPQAGKDLDAPRIVTVIREAAALFLNRSSLGQAAAVVIDRPEGSLWANRLRVGRFFSVVLRRTLRVPEDGKDYPLPPGFKEPFPIFRIQDYADKVPQHWLKEGGFFIPMHQREAMFLEFSGFKWHPQAAKIAVGNINAITGEEFSESIRAHKQDYVVIPDQKWLDGINALGGRVRQFVAMPLGKGYTIEEQITDEARFGGIQIGVFDARPGLFPDEDPEALRRRLKELAAREEARKQREKFKGAQFMPDVMYMPAIPGPHRPKDDLEMGIAAGGSIRQQIFEDQYGYQTWDEQSLVRLTIRIVDTVTFKRITGRDAPPTPVSAEHYTRARLPWFRYYDESAPSVAPSGILARIRGLREIDKLKGVKVSAPKPPIEIKPEQLREIAVPTRAQRVSELRESCEICLRARRYALGKRQADLLLELSPKDVTGLMVRAECNRLLSRFTEAILDASECLEIEDALLPLKTRASSYIAIGNYSGAKGDATAIITKAPKSHSSAVIPVKSDGLLLRADAEYHLDELGHAVVDLAEIFKQDEHHVDARTLAVKVIYKLGNYELAIKNANMVLQHSPNNATALLYRGDCYFRIGDMKQATQDLQQVVQLAPRTKYATHAAQLLEKARQFNPPPQ